MVWCEIKYIENSKYNNTSKLIIFDFLGKENIIIVTSKVLRYLGLNTFEELENYKEIFVLKSFNIKNEPIFIMKKIK